jgi:pyruvate ferredoxin oxidoreductase delta subunit
MADLNVTWQKKPQGGMIDKPGSALEFQTGSWRGFRPVWNPKKCTQCILCAVYCPENTIPVKGGKRTETDLAFCKGCGRCAAVCPVKCIEMKPEGDFKK